MKQHLGLAALAVLAAVVVSGCAAPGSTASVDQPSSAPTSMSMAAPAGMESMIHFEKEGLATPASVAAGAEVTIMNMDTAEHSVVSDDGSSFDVAVPAGGMATFTAPAKPGAYPFHSGTTEKLHGVLTVAPLPGSATPSEAAPSEAAPSEAAKMVCAEQARQTVQTIVGTAAQPEPTESWDGSTYTCTYPLAAGDFIMSVTEAADNPSAETLARDLATKAQATPIEGLANLGLPGYRSAAGNVIFAKDNMALQVDATALTDPVGPEKTTPADFAYQMATTILGCWTAHH